MSILTPPGWIALQIPGILMLYTTMLGKPYQSTWTDNLDPELAEYIQQVAQRTVFDNKYLLNIK